MSLKESSQQWWDRVKADPVLFNDWLQRQFRGEVTASNRIVKLAEGYPDITSKQQQVLYKIAQDELQHAHWILNLLEARGIPTMATADAEKRYWAKTLPGIEDFKTGCAVAAHAEAMRLARIEVICEDTDAPGDVRDVFAKILKDERFHERAFREFGGEEAMLATAEQHGLGLRALGLEA